MCVDQVHILTSPEGRKTVPSFVAFDGAQYLVGDEAKAQQTRNIANTVYGHEAQQNLQLEAKILQESAGAPLNVPSSGAITIGADVEVFGLKGAPEHNGKTGKVTSFDVRRYAPTLVQQQGSISSIHTYRRLLL